MYALLSERQLPRIYRLITTMEFSLGMRSGPHSQAPRFRTKPEPFGRPTGSYLTMTSGVVCALGLVVGLFGCTARLTGTDQTTSGSGGRDGGGVSGASSVSEADSTRFECRGGTFPQRNALRRLSRVEYVNSVRELCSLFADKGAVFAALQTTIQNQVPEDAADPPTGHPIVGANFQELDQNEGQAHVGGFFNVARRFGALATETAERTLALVGSCSIDGNTSNDPACLRDFVARFGARVMRRELLPSEVDFFVDVATDRKAESTLTAAAIKDVITVLLSSPDFLYQVETAGSYDADSKIYHLAPAEVAARLSYLFWQSPPDEQLLAAARASRLGSPEDIETQAQRLVQDPRFVEVVARFSSQWLKLDRMPHPEGQVGQKSYDLFRRDITPTAELRGQIATEARELVASAARQGGLSTLFTTRAAFVHDSSLAAIYGVDVGAPELPVERSGLLTRAALLLTASTSTRPIMKGVFVRRNLLCDALPDPPPNVDRNQPPPLTAPYTVRQAVSALTETRAQCSACHVSINALGYPTENFDGLGRLRTTERQLDLNGVILGELPVDTQSTPRITPDDVSTVRDGVELGQRLAASPKPAACIARQMVRFAQRVAEDASNDGCQLEAVRAKLASGASLAEAWTALARLDSFTAFQRAP